MKGAGLKYCAPSPRIWPDIYLFTMQLLQVGRIGVEGMSEVTRSHKWSIKSRGWGKSRGPSCGGSENFCHSFIASKINFWSNENGDEDLKKWSHMTKDEHSDIDDIKYRKKMGSTLKMGARIAEARWIYHCPWEWRWSLILGNETVREGSNLQIGQCRPEISSADPDSAYAQTLFTVCTYRCCIQCLLEISTVNSASMYNRPLLQCCFSLFLKNNTLWFQSSVLYSKNMNIKQI